jgi:hypothetical protein
LVCLWAGVGFAGAGFRENVGFQSGNEVVGVGVEEADGGFLVEFELMFLGNGLGGRC